MHRIGWIILLLCLNLWSQNKIALSPQEQGLSEQLRGLRRLDDEKRRGVTRQLALDIRKLPVTVNKLNLAAGLANLSTEGDFGKDTLQEVTTTFAAAIEEQPGATPLYTDLARLVRYEHMKASSTSPHFEAAMKLLEEEDRLRANADFTLSDLSGKSWTLKALKGKVVLLNFWATWCPPCRKEMPDLQWLSKNFAKQGLIILAISDEAEAKVRPFIEAGGFNYPILLDPGSQVNKQLKIEGIPKSFVYDREGKLVAQSIDMRTREQFLEMLAQAGLK